MSWSNREWERRDEETVAVASEVSIYLPRPTWDYEPEMHAYLTARSLDHALARRLGWYPAWFKGPRIVVPCIRTDHKNFFQARLLENMVEKDMMFREWKRWESPFGKRGDALTYLNAPGANTVVIVEGPMDALAAITAGASAIATLGVGAPGPVLAHVAMLAQNYKKVIIVPDRDEVGPWTRIQKELGRMGVVSEIREPFAKDLADMVPANREALIHGT